MPNPVSQKIIVSVEGLPQVQAYVRLLNQLNGQSRTTATSQTALGGAAQTASAGMNQSTQATSANTQALNANSQSASNASQHTNAMASSMGKMAKGALTAGAAIVAIKKVSDLADIGAQAQNVGKSFDHMASIAGMSTSKMMSELKRASGGMMNSVEMQQTAMKGLISGIKFEDMITSMEYVR